MAAHTLIIPINLSALSSLKLICTVDKATSVEQLAIKWSIDPSSLRDLTVQVATFPLI